MIRAYDKLYLERARALLGRMLDFAVYDLKLEICGFYRDFCESEYAAKFERGDATLLAGKSGIELAYDITCTSSTEPRFTSNRSPEYWAGWALAYYQWYTALSFGKINSIVPIEDVLAMYPKYHEMDIMQFVDAMNEAYAAQKRFTNLKERRREAGLSQSELAKISGVPLRTIQQYEQRQKNINCARAETLLALAQALSCPLTDLLEIPAVESGTL